MASDQEKHTGPTHIVMRDPHGTHLGPPIGDPRSRTPKPNTFHTPTIPTVGDHLSPTATTDSDTLTTQSEGAK